MVSTHEGPQVATRFFVNGEEPTRRITTAGGYVIQGTLTHRIKVVTPTTGEWVWKRLADVASDDIVPLQTGTLVGDVRPVPLPVLDQAYYGGDHRLAVPNLVDEDLAELVGYFMGDGSLHAKGIRLCVADKDLDVVERLRVLGKDLFNIEAEVTQQRGYQEITYSSIRLARWWKAAGFAKTLPREDHAAKGWTPRIPSAILETNDHVVYAAFLRGLYEADAAVPDGVPTLSTASESFANEIRTLTLTLGLVTTTRKTQSGWGGAIYQIRLRNLDYAIQFARNVGFLSERKARLVPREMPSSRAGKGDRIVLARELWDELVPVGSERRSVVVNALARYGGVARGTALKVYEATRDPRLREALQYVYESVAANEDGGIQPTFDLSVPANVAYVAAGFVSHNTIGLAMDCDTTGIEPDLALVKFKKLVGGGSMQIVNQTVPRALRKLGYQDEQVEAIVEYVAEHGHVVDAPGLRPEHYEVFDCAMGERAIAPMGHVNMMAAVQPLLSGAISKTVNVPEEATVEDVEEMYHQGWKLGLKALAIYRDNCKVGQPLSVAKSGKAGADEREERSVQTAGAEALEPRSIRRRLPKTRPSKTTSFTVGGAEGYMTASSYPDNGLGEVFLKMSKQGSTLAGMMDAFSIAVSIALQYGVPLETYVQKFTNMRFEPAGMTDDPDIRMAASIVDYIFRRLALDYLPYDTRAAMGIHTAEERTRQLETGSYLPEPELDVEALAQSAPVAPDSAKGPQEAAGKGGPVRPEPTGVEEVVAESAKPAPRSAHSSTELIEAQLGRTADAPLCLTCGTKMRPAGSCYVCEGCGSTSGCS
jgi:ribonucleoside-diphosphate reductase alpha chain